MLNNLPLAAFAYGASSYRESFGEKDWIRLEQVARVPRREPITDFGDPDLTDLLSEIRVLITGWNAPPLTPAALARMPKLELMAHMGATIKRYVDPSVWDRGIRVTAAVEAVALPVVEYTIAAIVFGSKRVMLRSHAYRQTRAWPTPGADPLDIGMIGQTIGIVGASRVGLPVIERLRDYDVEVLVYDPFFSAQHAGALGAEKLESLDDLMMRADVVSIHAPITAQTIGMIDARRLALMRDGAVLINTARGVLVDHDALIAELQTGRISAFLDVTYPEPLPPDSPLFTLPNVFLTPHVAGPMGRERQRMFTAAVDDIVRHFQGRPLRGIVAADALERLG